MNTLPAYCAPPLGLRIGNRSRGVTVLQEWLCLNRHAVTVDGQYGPATARAIGAWRNAAGLPASDTLTQRDIDTLTAPMIRALRARGGMTEIAHAHLVEHPREVGRANAGPWVRLYSRNRPPEAWCAHFVAWCAAQSGLPADVTALISPSCDQFAQRAATARRFSITPRVGGAFLVRGAFPGDWTHTGIVTAVHPGGTIGTIEGNTNDEGSREGYEVCARTRNAAKLDFVDLDPGNP